MTKALITVITVTYNCEKLIRKTIESILSQNYPFIEFILVDGCSSDATYEIGLSYRNKFEEKGYLFKSLSEKDFGIYDAMNKGIKQSTGNWVNFMNAGDTFFAPNVLTLLFGKTDATEPSDVLYGDVNCIYEWGDSVVKAKNIELIRQGMVFCHQAAFVKGSVIKAHPFHRTFKIAADYHLFYSLYLKNFLFRHLPVVVANYENESGVSATRLRRLYHEIAVIQGVNQNIIWRMRFNLFIWNLEFRTIIKNCLPNTVRIRIKKKRYKTANS